MRLYLIKGWLLREVRGNWIKQRRYWFVLSQDSLDYYSGPEKGARRLGTLVLTNLCSVIWPDKQTYKETGEQHTRRSRLSHADVQLTQPCSHLPIISLEISKACVDSLHGVVIGQSQNFLGHCFGFLDMYVTSCGPLSPPMNTVILSKFGKPQPCLIRNVA